MMIHKKKIAQINVRDSNMVIHKKNKIAQINVHVESHGESCDV
jgi:hypothetical protein